MQNPPSNNAHGIPVKKNYKLIVDPHLKKGREKLTRFNGNAYSSEDHGQPPLVVRDPRPRVSRLLSRREKTDLPIPRYKVDEHYIGVVPPREITFSKLNDNITKEFIERMCGKFGKMERVRVYYHPKTNKHMGLAKVVYASIKSAALCIEHLHQTSIMGNIINVEMDCKGELLKQLHHKIIKGEMMADTMPDVIKHTQEKPIRRERRKSSRDDPRRHSQSDSRKQSVDDNSHGPRTPPMSTQNSFESQGPSIHSKNHESHLERNSSITFNDSNSFESQELNNISQHSPVQVNINSEKHKPQLIKQRKVSISHNEDINKTELLEKLSTIDLETRLGKLIPKETEKFNSKKKNRKQSHGDHKFNHKQHNSTGTSASSNSRKSSTEISQDLEDGECSGDDPSNETATTPEEPKIPKPEPIVISPASVKPDIDENTSNSTHFFRRSPSPLPPVPPPQLHPSHRDFERHQGRHSPNYYRHHPSRHHGSPERRSPDFRFHPDRYEPRRRSPPFDIRRRHSPPPFGPHRSKSPSFDPLRRHHSPPFRGRPPQFRHHREFPPDVVRSPMSGFDRHRRSMSPPLPRRFPSPPPPRREFDGSPPRDRFYQHGSDIRHRREVSPRFAEFERHRRKSPGYHHRHHRPPSPGKRRLRDHRDLPPEFLERWSRRSQSPPPRRDRDHPHRPYPEDEERRLKHRSSLSPNSHHSNQTPLRIRSPVPLPSDNNPYSPGDLAVEEVHSEEPNISATDLTESDPGFKKGGKKSKRLSSDQDQPFISLDERLRELTGEPPPESPPHSPIKPPPKDHSPVGSEDMDISSEEGNPQTNNPPPGWHPDREAWNNQFDQNQNFRLSEAEQRRMWDARNEHEARFSRPHLQNGFGPSSHFGMAYDPMRPMIPFEQKGFLQQAPGWEQAWVQGNMGAFHPGGFPNNMNPNFQGIDFNKQLSEFILNRITGELKEIIKRDLNKKVIETMAFKVYEQWWDDQNANKNQKQASKTLPIKTETDNPTDSTTTEKNPTTNKNACKLPALLNTFDPLNWAKGSFEMDGFRIGLGLRSAISKMPSFRVKKRTPTPPPVKIKKERDNDNKSSRHKFEDKRHSNNNRKRIWQDLDSEGEDAESETESLIEHHERLDVDEVFSSSSSSSEEEEEEEEDEDESDEETESGSEVEDEKVKKVVKNETFKRPSISDPFDLEPPKKKHRNLDNENYTAKYKDNKVNRDARVDLSAKNPPLSELPQTNLTQQQLRSVHPKKRYRLLSKDETQNLDLIAEVSDRLRSEDEVSNMSDKEKAALEALTGMKTTPERRLSSLNNRFSESSDSSEQPLHPLTPGRQLSENVFSPPATPIVLRRASSGVDTTKSPLASMFRDAKSGSEELEAVEALLSIKQSHPIMAPLSPPPVVKETRKTPKKRPYLPQNQHVIIAEERDRMTAIAEEHNYFAISPASKRPKNYDVTYNPIVERIYEEHCYSQPPIDTEPQPTILQPDAWRRDAPVIAQQILTAAERVKLRREKPKKKTIKKETWKPTQQFRPRTRLEELSLIYLMWGTGIDLEDMKLLRHEYEEMLANPKAPAWVQDTHWTPHPITHIEDQPTGSPYKRRSKKDKGALDVKPHKTGCSRSEGYYKVGDTTKLQQRKLMYRQTERVEEKGDRRKQTDSPANPAFLATEKSREERQLMRRIVSEFGSDASDLLKYNQLAYRKKSVKFKRSSIHGWGLFAEETIGADEMVIEYVGQLVRSLVADRREVHYTKRGIGSSYLFRIDGDHIIDATKCGNYARFMNHSCNPSCYAKVITVDGAKKIVIYSKDTIKPKDEITYDYKFPLEDDKIPCFCGSHNCRGTLN